jgi:GTP-binding protein
MDIRHAPTVLDEQLVEWFSMTGKPIHVLLTKSDKLIRSEVQKKLGEVSDILVGQYAQVTVQVFSSLNRAGLNEARAKLIEWLS